MLRSLFCRYYHMRLCLSFETVPNAATVQYLRGRERVGKTVLAEMFWDPEAPIFSCGRNLTEIENWINEGLIGHPLFLENSITRLLSSLPYSSGGKSTHVAAGTCTGKFHNWLQHLKVTLESLSQASEHLIRLYTGATQPIVLKLPRPSG